MSWPLSGDGPVTIRNALGRSPVTVDTSGYARDVEADPFGDDVAVVSAGSSPDFHLLDATLSHEVLRADLDLSDVEWSPTEPRVLFGHNVFTTTITRVELHPDGSVTTRVVADVPGAGGLYTMAMSPTGREVLVYTAMGTTYLVPLDGSASTLVHPPERSTVDAPTAAFGLGGSTIWMSVGEHVWSSPRATPSRFTLRSTQPHRVHFTGALDAAGRPLVLLHDERLPSSFGLGGLTADLGVVDEDSGEVDVLSTWRRLDRSLGSRPDLSVARVTAPTGGECDALTPSIVGTAGPDTIVGTPGDDVIWAGAGDDVVDAGGGDDIVCGGGGADTVTGGDGADRLLGGDGDDLLDGGAGRDLLLGQAGPDRLVGGTGDDQLAGGAGDDTITGSAGGDLLLGEGGADVVDGGEGDDVVGGGAGPDLALGSGGDDLVLVTPGDRVDAGEGDDAVYGRGGSGTGGPGDDDVTIWDTTAVLDGGDGDDRVYGGGTGAAHGGAGDDVMRTQFAHVFGDAGDDRIDLRRGPGGTVHVDAGAGADWVSAQHSHYPTVIDAGPDADTVIGSLLDDTISGGTGDDVVDALGGDDQVDGGEGDDSIRGGRGDDVLVGGGGEDRLHGGDGTDQCIPASAADRTCETTAQTAALLRRA